jgi:histidine ammonia-lyase
MDYLSVALTDLGNMSERRVMRMTDEDSNTHVLPAFLTRHGGLNSGFMIAQYTAAALATHNKVLAHPAVTDTIPSSANVEDHVSMGVTSGLKLHEILDNVERIIAIELLAAAQGIDFRREALPLDARLGEGTRRAYALVRECVPFIERDTLMHPHIEAARKLVSCGAVCAAAFAEVRDTP